MSSLALFVMMAAGIGLVDILLRRFGPRGARIMSRDQAIDTYLEEFPYARRDSFGRVAVSADGQVAFIETATGSTGLVRMLGQFPVVRSLVRGDVAWARSVGDAGMEAGLDDLTIRRLKAEFADAAERDAVLAMLGR